MISEKGISIGFRAARNYNFLTVSIGEELVIFEFMICCNPELVECGLGDWDEFSLQIPTKKFIDLIRQLTKDGKCVFDTLTIHKENGKIHIHIDGVTSEFLSGLPSHSDIDWVIEKENIFEYLLMGIKEVIYS